MKKIIEKFKELKKHPNGSAIMFFGFYVIFFIFLFVFIGINGNKKYLFQEYEKGNKKYLNFSSILSKNYFYDYKINVNGILNDYYGRRYGDTETFKYNNNDYYRKDNEFLINNGTWVKSENPYLYYDLINVDNLELILSNAFHLSQTEYEDGKVEYNYLISTNTLNNLFYNMDTDYDDVPNKIILYKDKDNNIYKIEYKLDSFCACNKVCNSLEIELNYEMFGNVLEIDSPVQ